MLLFQKLVDETQMPKPQEYTDTFILTKKLFLVGLRGLRSISNLVKRPCTIIVHTPIDYWGENLGYLQAPFGKKPSSQDTVEPDLSSSVPTNLKELPAPLCIGHSIVEVQ